LQGDALSGLNFGDLELKTIDFETGTAKFDLLLIMEEGRETLKGVLEYNADLFTAETVERMMRHFAYLLDQIAQAPDTHLDKIGLLPPEEEQNILLRWNQTAADYPKSPFIHQYTAQFALSNPDHPALLSAQGTFTYRQFEERGNQLAHYLVSHGIGRDDRVGVCMDRSAEMVIALHGILKAGAAYVPFDPRHPAERRRFMLDDSGARLILTQAHLLDLFKGSSIHAVVLDASFALIESLPVTPPVVDIDGDQLAYMIYTSGSTGKPKGTFLAHKSILNRLIWMQESYGLTMKDVVLQKTPFSFDVSVWEFFWPFMQGATLAIAREEGHKDSAYLTETVRQYGVTTLHFVPPMLKVFLEDRDSKKCISLKRVVCSGEALPYALSEQFYKTLPNAVLYNLYGPTEAAVDVTAYTCPRDRDDKKLPIGSPIANTQIYILDPALNPVPVGVGGELYIAGVQLARGYANRPGLTAEKFIADPYAKSPGSRMYKTGDLCRYLPGGEIEYLGRIDHQVKLRGFRIELGEIEAVLRGHPAIKDCIVLVRGTDMEKAIIAWYIPEEGQSPVPEDLRQYIIRHMPEYMAPNFFIPLDAFPLTSNGKLDRRGLPDVNLKKDRPKTRFVSPRNRLEAHLAELWREILGVKTLSMYDNFFDIGGNSLKAAVLINRLQEEVDKKLHVGMVFQAPRIAEFAMFAQEYFTEEVLKNFGDSAVGAVDDSFKVMAISAESKIKNADIQAFRQIVFPLQKRKKEPTHLTKNKPAIFILSPPRSGSTLLRIMLAGNPVLFSPPELDLLSFNTIGERRRFFEEQGLPLWLEATTHAIKEIQHTSLAEAERIMRDIEDKDITVKDFYHLLQNGLKQKILVDKTPSYAIDPAALQRAEEDFEQPLYVHLARHPYAMIYSFIEAKLDKNFFKFPHKFTRQQLAELIWLNSHQNILDFLKDIPDERHVFLRFEDLLFKPEAEIRRLTEFLGVPFTADMLKPYQGRKMTEGLKQGSQMVGDFKFYLHQNINNKVAGKWRGFHKHDFLCEQSEILAGNFGYETHTRSKAIAENTDIQKIEQAPRQTYMPLSFAQQRLWFIDQLEPGSTQYNVPGAIYINGNVDARLLEKSIALLVERHEILRTTFHTIEGKGMQKIHAEYQPVLIQHDLRTLPTEQKDVAAQGLIDTLSKTVFKLNELPILKIMLVRLKENEYIFALVAHHIITDGWSNGIIIREASHYYDLLIEEKSVVTPALALQYVDIAVWQREWINGNQAGQQLNFWKKELKGAPPLLDIPTDFPRKANNAPVGKRLYFELGEAISQKVRTCCNRQGTTSFVVLMAAFQTLMHHYAAQQEVLIGTPVAGRTQQAMEGLIGFFVNTIVQRTQFKPGATFRDILDQVRDKAARILNHQDYPFEKLLEALNVQRSLEHAPLFQVMFSMQEDDICAFSKNFATRPYRTDSGTAKFDLLLELFDSNSIRGAFEYNTSLFRAETIKRLKDHFERLLIILTTQMDIPIAEINFIGPHEEELLTHKWNDTALDFPNGQTVPQQIMEQARKRPGAPALTFEGHTFLYAEFNQKVNQWAHLLVENGVQREQRVAVCLERSDNMVLALNAVMRCGGVYVPLDPGHPVDRTTFMLQDSGARTVITTTNLADKFENQEIRIIFMDSADVDKQPSSDPTIDFDLDQLAYMIYTSGSTGKPKGTLLTHRGFLNRLQWMQQAYPLGPGETVLQKTPFSFDVSVWEFFWPFMFGARLVVARDGGHKDTAYLTDLIRRENVTTMHFVPPMLKVFLEERNAGACTSLKNVVCSGEALPYALSREFYKTLPTARLHNLYGPTEASVDVSHYTCPVEREDGKLPIGRPIANTLLYVLNPALKPVPVGVRGELHIGGVQLARGYANRPDLTAEKFIPDPFGKVPGARLYKTGDVCRFLPTGEIEYIGRMDHQVKVRGFRIELGEIESALRKGPGVEDCTVQVRPFGSQEKALVAYVVSKEQQPSQATLKDALKKNLPDYMVPSAWLFIDKIPLTANGKIDRESLPNPADLGRNQLENAYLAPRNDREKQLSDLWMKVLKLDKVGVRDNFFELGGDSIVGIQLISASARDGLTFTPRELFENPTIEGLATIAREGVAIHAEQQPITGEVELTPILLWFKQLDLPQRAHWNQSIMLKSQAALKPDILQGVANTLYAHHDMLRLYWDDGSPMIATQTTEAPLFEYQDLRRLNLDEQKSSMKKIVEKTQSGHDLQRGPLFKILYFSLDSAIGDRLFISIHHTVIDAVSWRVLLEDLQLAYARFSEEKPLTLPAKTTSFAYYAKRLKEYARTTDWGKEMKFWQNFIGQEAASLKMLKTGKNLQKDRIHIDIKLNIEQTANLQRVVPETYNTRVVENLLTALFIAWKNLKGTNSLLIDMEGHGREALFEEVDLARTVGWFTSLFPVHLHTSESDLGEVIKSLKEEIRAIPENGINYGLLRFLAPETVRKEIEKLPSAGILFNYLGQFEQDEAMKSRFEMKPGETGADIGAENRNSHLLEITSSIVNGVFNITFNFCPDSVSESFIVQFADKTVQALDQIIEHSLSGESGGYTPSDFSAMEVDQEELDDILSELDDLE